MNDFDIDDLEYTGVTAEIIHENHGCISFLTHEIDAETILQEKGKDI